MFYTSDEYLLEFSPSVEEFPLIVQAPLDFEKRTIVLVQCATASHLGEHRRPGLPAA